MSDLASKQTETKSNEVKIKSFNKIQLAGGIIGALAFIVFAFFITPTEILSHQALVALGALLAAVIWMLTNFMPDYLGMLSMCLLWVLFGAANISMAFNAYAGSSWWLLFGALVVGVAAQETDLLRRLALIMMDKFPATFIGQSLSLVVSGVVISPMIASQTAKSAIVAPIARSLSESMGYEYRSKGAKGIFMSFYTGYTSAGMAFLSASFVSYTVIGLLEGTEYAIGWGQYFRVALPWLIVSTVLMFLFTIKAYNPKDKTPVGKDYARGQLDKMGPWTLEQKIVMLLLIACLVLWMFETVVGIAAWMVACLAAVILMLFGIVDRKLLRTKVAWDAMVFLGCFLGIGRVFSETGVNTWVASVLSAPLSNITSNIWAFIISIAVVTYIVRFVLVSWTSTVLILGSVLIPVCIGAGIHPFLALITIYVSTNTWNVIYQSTPVVTSMVATDNMMVTHTDILPASIAYMVVNIIALMASIPIWKLMGLY